MKGQEGSISNAQGLGDTVALVEMGEELFTWFFSRHMRSLSWNRRRSFSFCNARFITSTSVPRLDLKF